MTCNLIRGILMAEGINPAVVEAAMPVIARTEKKVVKKVKRKASAYSMRYSRHFKKVAKKYQKKSGAWAKDGFKRAQREAHRLAKRG
jgi:hypothetical protein